MCDEAACEHGPGWAKPSEDHSTVLRLLALLVVGVLVLHPTTVPAQYVVGPSVMAGGGARLAGGSYVVTGTTGQSSPIDVSSGGAYVTRHGFWHAVGGGGLVPMALAIELLNATTGRLSWDAVAGATHYDLYRSSTAYLAASGTPWQTVAAPTTHRDFTGGIGNTAINYFFRGKARNATQTSAASNIVGEFDFGISTAVTGKTRPAEDPR